MSLSKTVTGSLPAASQQRLHLHRLFTVVYFQEFLSSFGLPICVESKVFFVNAYLSVRHLVFGTQKLIFSDRPLPSPLPVNIECAERSSCSLERVNVGRVAEPGTSSARLPITSRTICGDDGRISLSGALCL